MPATVKIDAAGRVRLPKSQRDQLQLAPGDILEVSAEGGALILRSMRALPVLYKERGIWVCNTGTPMSAADTNAALRRARAPRTVDALARR